MIDRILADLSKTEGIKGSMVVGKDGLVIASQIPSNLDNELIGAMASAAFGSAERTANEINQGNLEQMMVEGEFGKTLMTDAGEGILVVLADSKVNLGLIRISMKKATEKIKAAF
ncbi:Roadblock/LC7 family protein [Methanococcus vannielii SB]|jgi:predicted regulator of Ras-like GTPase activity (Roadblock/LC7/MglB family)|uniref:Roadblock/LC7 family protein n=1 Tax=Methanococcus vannielii (strain ATCC 35089 / DSM 1224 / JCM 13029 / OCM 148 / SB) TaxID=406327 RepID=A6UQZ7_METVS|nr:roadblock/LC7 domain-containing protein [Methanococcus vannielii]ABR54919.1 Roadblock/LC7 family protein [Methanococcus vannielii SB]